MNLPAKEYAIIIAKAANRHGVMCVFYFGLKKFLTNYGQHSLI